MAEDRRGEQFVFTLPAVNKFFCRENIHARVGNAGSREVNDTLGRNSADAGFNKSLRHPVFQKIAVRHGRGS